MNKILLVLMILSFSSCFTDRSEQQVTLQVDWASYMKKHNLIWEIFPGRWENVPFIGNGLVGSIIYASPDSTNVKWYLGRSDIGKLDFPGGGNIPIRIQII